MSLQIISLAASILCPVLTALVMWGYKSDQKRIRESIEQIAKDSAEGIAQNTASIEKLENRHSSRMDKIEANLSDLKADLPHVYVLREDYIRTMNNVDTKLDKLLHSRREV